MKYKYTTIHTRKVTIRVNRNTMDSVYNTIHNHMFDSCRNIMIVSLYNVFYINGILILLSSTTAYVYAYILVIYMTECGDNTDTYMIGILII